MNTKNVKKSLTVTPSNSDVWKGLHESGVISEAMAIMEMKFLDQIVYGVSKDTDHYRKVYRGKKNRLGKLYYEKKN